MMTDSAIDRYTRSALIRELKLRFVDRKVTVQRFQTILSRRIDFLYRLATAERRAFPTCFIVGAQKCGTTSLFSSLSEHPEVAAVYDKEPHYFAYNRRMSQREYRAHYAFEGSGLSIDASTNYLLFKRAAQRIHQFNPQARIIAVLRDPVARAFSHYRHNLRKRREWRSFSDAIAEALCRHPSELILEASKNETEEHAHFAYVAKGLYELQLQQWTSVFPPEQLLVLKAEQLFTDHKKCFKAIASFLEISSWEPSFLPHKLRGLESDQDPDAFRKLAEYYQVPNHDLRKQYGELFQWNNLPSE